MAIRVPRVTSIENAVLIYYSNLDLGNKEIRELFGPLGSARLVGLKRLVIEEMKNRGQLQYDSTSVRTKTAYEVWGLDIADLEKRLAKLRKLCS